MAAYPASPSETRGHGYRLEFGRVALLGEHLVGWQEKFRDWWQQIAEFVQARGWGKPVWTNEHKRCRYL
jgi:hypothetical protein